MPARSPEDPTEQRRLRRGWRHIIAGQSILPLLTLPMLRVHPALTATATAFDLVALANTMRIHRFRNRARTAGHAPPATAGRDLATVAACIVGTALCAVVLAVWPR